MEVTNPANFFEDKIISNCLLTDQIFRYLTKSELLDCSLVSTKWISPSRKYLQSHHECLLRINANDLGTTSELLDDCKEIFYNGIYWDYSKRRHDVAKIDTVLDGFHIILTRLPKMKFVTMKVFVNDMIPLISTPDPHKICPVELLAIEKLKIIGIILPITWNTVFGQEVFWNLKTIDLRYFYIRYDHALHRFPVLQEWSSSVMLHDVEYFVAANKLTAIKNLKICGSIPPDVLHTFEAGSVALRRLDVFFDPAYAEQVDIFRRVTAASTTSLKEVRLTYTFCKLLIVAPEIPPLVNVKKLVVNPPREDPRSEDIQAEMLADSNVRQKFPNAEIITLHRLIEFD